MGKPKLIALLGHANPSLLADFAHLERKLKIPPLEEYDFHTLEAAKMFGVRPEQVTVAQRSRAKARLHIHNYGIKGSKE